VPAFFVGDTPEMPPHRGGTGIPQINPQEQTALALLLAVRERLSAVVTIQHGNKPPGLTRFMVKSAVPANTEPDIDTIAQECADTFFDIITAKETQTVYDMGYMCWPTQAGDGTEYVISLWL
jgi:hypothetical protein